MTSVAPETPRKIMRTRRPNAGVAVRPDKTDDKHRTPNRHGVVEDYFGAIDTRRKGSSLRTYAPPDDGTREAIEQNPSSTGFNIGRLPVIVPEITLLPSPSGSASTTSSPGSDRGVWDSPETPSLRPAQQLELGSITPLTPPTTYELSPDDTPSRKPSEVFSTSNVRGGDIFDRSASRTPNQNDEGSLAKSVDQDEESFQPQKLFRGLTDQFRAISKRDGKAATQLNLQSSYTFNFDTNPPVSSRTRSNTKVEVNLKEKDVKAIIKTEVDVVEVKAEAEAPSQIRTPPKGFQGDLEQIISSEIHNRLREYPNQCVASLVTRTPGRRCSYNSAKGKPTAFTRLLKDISTCNRKNDRATLFKHVDELIGSILCTRHQISARVRITKVVGILGKPRVSNELSIFSEWAKTISAPALPSQMETATKNTVQIKVNPGKYISGRPKSSLTPLSMTSATEPATAVNLSTSTKLVPDRNVAVQVTTPTITTVPLISSLKFLPFQPNWSKGLTISKALLHVITDALTPTDEKNGFIYIFWDREHFGRVKIGRTNNLDRRLEQWNKQCKRIFSYHKASRGGELVEIPHVNRIERLMHIELKECRRQRKCEGCKTNHREWFEVREAQAVKVFQKWQQWILQKPYALDRVSGQWRIRPEMMHTLAQVCEPVLEDAVQVKIGPKKDDKRRKSKRLSSLTTK